MAPLWPHTVQRAHCRSLSLEVSGPQRMTSGVSAIGARWRHSVLLHDSHAQHMLFCSWASVGTGPTGDL